MVNEYKRLRVDKWLWAARFFKTRSLAADAIGKNRIRVDGQKIKPSRVLQVGDVVQIEKPPFQFEVTVLGLNDQRRPASEAALLYRESEASVLAREAQAARVRADRLARVGEAGQGRPSRRQRRQIIRFQNSRLHDKQTPNAGTADEFLEADTPTDSLDANDHPPDHANGHSND